MELWEIFVFFCFNIMMVLILLLFIQRVVDGNDVGSIQSKLLCRSILDLYIGDDPFDKQAKDDVHSNIASLLKD